MSGAISGFISGGMTSNACFVAGTAILTSVGYVVIEEIRAGDMVWAEDPETGKKELKEVVQTFINETDELVHVFVNDEEIITTPEHPFYAPCKGWTEAVSLRAGDILVLQNGKYVIVEKVQHEILEAPIPVYNFEVKDFHTYYVGNSAVLVHNVCGNRQQLRKNMLKQGAAPGSNYQAHYGLPWKHRNYFGSAGLNVNDVKYGRWVIGEGNGGHQSWSRRYERLWDNYIKAHPKADARDIVDYFNRLNGVR